MEQQNFMVCVSCMTYNHAPYITDALNGFCMQETTFPFVCTIVDDASTDGEQDVIKKYLQENFDLEDKMIVRNEETDDYILTFARHKTNKNCFFAVLYLKYNHYRKKSKMPYVSEWRENSKYIAYCEGDDFWINPKFLQTSVSFLDEHQDYSAVFGNRLVSDENGNITSKVRLLHDLTIHDIMRGNNMGLRNLCFRQEIWNLTKQITSTRDLHIYLKCAICGKMKYFDMDFAVYRFSQKGIYTSLNQKDRVYVSYSHYFELHQEVGFQYQKDYVYYQMKILLSHLEEPTLFKYSIQLIRQLHAPSKMRYVWYLQYGTLLFCKGVLKKMVKALK